jgi:hypothetical protein
MAEAEATDTGQMPTLHDERAFPTALIRLSIDTECFSYRTNKSCTLNLARAFPDPRYLEHNPQIAI